MVNAGRFHFARSLLILTTAAFTCAGGLVGLGGCDREKSYSQKSPDDVLKSAVEMVRNGDTDKLDDLIYADTPEMRRTLAQLGTLLGHMQQLAGAVQQRFPEELADLKAEAEKAAAEGKANSLLGTLMQATGGGGGSGGGRASEPNPEELRRLMNSLFADPYGWIEQNAARLSTTEVSDDLAMVLVDGQPAIPVVGLPLRLEGDKWYVALPTNIPPVTNFMPRSTQQWSILRSLIKIIDNAVIEMRSDVQTGKVATLDGVAKKAQDKVIFPAAIGFAAYSREIDVRTRVERRMKQFQARQREWVKTRETLPPERGGGPISPKLLAAMTRIAPAAIEKGVRKREPAMIEGIDDVQFEKLAESWLASQDLRIDWTAELSPSRIDSTITAWEQTTSRTAANPKKDK